jgi:hypothetical protein
MRLLTPMLAMMLLAALTMGCAAPSSPLVTNAEQRTISQSEFAAILAKLRAHWHPDPAVFSQPDQSKYVVVVRVQLDSDGRLSAPVQIVSTGAGPLYQATAEAAKRAVELSQPFDMLSPSAYDAWKDIEIRFDPNELKSIGQRPQSR